jgi:hypothetical protein
MWTEALETAKAEVERAEHGLEMVTEMEGYFTREMEQAVQSVEGGIDRVPVDLFLQDVKAQ